MSDVLNTLQRLEKALMDLEEAFIEKLEEQQETIRNLNYLLGQSESTTETLEMKTKSAAARLDRLSEKIRLLLGA